jgi:hypothetical protein
MQILANVTLGMAESSTVKAAVSFLSSFICQSREMEPLQAVVQAQGEELVRKILACIGNHLPFDKVFIDINVVLFFQRR